MDLKKKDARLRLRLRLLLNCFRSITITIIAKTGNRLGNRQSNRDDYTSLILRNLTRPFLKNLKFHLNSEKI